MIDRTITQRFKSFDEIAAQEDTFYRNLPPLERLRLGVQLQEDSYGPLRHSTPTIATAYPRATPRTLSIW